MLWVNPDTPQHNLKHTQTKAVALADQGKHFILQIYK